MLPLLNTIIVGLAIAGTDDEVLDEDNERNIPGLVFATKQDTLKRRKR